MAATDTQRGQKLRWFKLLSRSSLLAAVADEFVSVHYIRRLINLTVRLEPPYGPNVERNSPGELDPGPCNDPRRDDPVEAPGQARLVDPRLVVHWDRAARSRPVRRLVRPGGAVSLDRDLREAGKPRSLPDLIPSLNPLAGRPLNAA